MSWKFLGNKAYVPPGGRALVFGHGSQVLPHISTLPVLGVCPARPTARQKVLLPEPDAPNGHRFPLSNLERNYCAKW